MSDTDSFIEEVSEEVRRDRLFGYMRRYGWIAVLAILALVGGAAWNEYSKSQARAKAQGAGNAILAALEADEPQERVKALEALQSEDITQGAKAVVSLMQAAEQAAGDDPAGAHNALGRGQEEISWHVNLHRRFTQRDWQRARGQTDPQYGQSRNQ